MQLTRTRTLLHHRHSTAYLEGYYTAVGHIYTRAKKHTHIQTGTYTHKHLPRRQTGRRTHTMTRCRRIIARARVVPKRTDECRACTYYEDAVAFTTLKTVIDDVKPESRNDKWPLAEITECP